MEKQDYIDYIKLELTADILSLEIEDITIGKYVDNAMHELQRYYDEPKLVTVPFASCIDLTGFKSSAIVKIYRTEGYMGDSASNTFEAGSAVDPMYAQQWMVFSNGGTMYNLNQYMLNYLSYNTLMQMRNTISTDMSFKEDKRANKLYINTSSRPVSITIEYIPVLQDVDEITSDYWIDILKRLSLAMVKIGLGRARTRMKQSNALWTDDGDVILEEGNTEIRELREILRTNSTYFYPID